MKGLDAWRLCSELKVTEAALLMVGIDPSSEVGSNCDGWKPHEQPDGYVAIKAALCHDILSGKLPARVRRSARVRGWNDEPGDGEQFTKAVHIMPSDWLEEGNPNIAADPPWVPAITSGIIFRAEPDWRLTTVSVDALRVWLTSRSVNTGFFFPDGDDAPDYLDPGNTRYAPKLAAAVQAWKATHDPQGETPKQALTRWLNENAKAYGLSNAKGKLNSSGIKECAKVANWQSRGGAPKTPGG
jgi:hypothetical protein